MLDHALVELEPARNTFSRPELLTLAETAEVLDVSPECVEAAVIAGDIPAKSLGGSWRIIRSQLHEAPLWGCGAS